MIRSHVKDYVKLRSKIVEAFDEIFNPYAGYERQTDLNNLREEVLLSIDKYASRNGDIEQILRQKKITEIIEE